MNDVERLAEALRHADAELDLASPDLTEALEHAHRRLISRLLLVGVLSALGATLLLTGGIKAGATIRDMRNNGNDKTESAKKKQVHSGHPQRKGGNPRGHGGPGNAGKNNNGKADGKHKPRHHPEHEPSGSGGTEAEGAPDLVVVALSSTEVRVKNIGETEAVPFSVAIWVVESESESELESTKVAVEVSFDRLPALEEAKGEVTGLECSAGQEIYAEVDYLDTVEEATDENNRSKPIVCEPPEENKDGKREIQREG